MTEWNTQSKLILFPSTGHHKNIKKYKIHEYIKVF